MMIIGKQKMELRSFTVYDLFKRNARVFHNRTAIQSDEGRITFGELYDRVNAVAGWLVSEGSGRPDRGIDKEPTGILHRGRRHRRCGRDHGSDQFSSCSG
ncbi:MAG: hypothetical protein D4R56_00610 [Deltaproteobacteria bacterium]|nr:MAG: hypothetical protein D4R56_00610 [Deltaproteobacteria bacterium]